MTTPAGRTARAVLAEHDLADGDDAAYERIAEAALIAHPRGDYDLSTYLVASCLDREGLAVEGAPETRAAAWAVVERLRTTTEET